MASVQNTALTEGLKSAMALQAMGIVAQFPCATPSRALGASSRDLTVIQLKRRLEAKGHNVSIAEGHLIGL
jgi:hypothetical protein